MGTYDVALRIRYRLEAASPTDAMAQLLSRIDNKTWPAAGDIEYLIRQVGQEPVATTATEPAEDLGKPIYTVSEAAIILGVSKSAMYELISTGRAQCIRLGKRSIRIPRNSLLKVLSGEGVGENSTQPARRPIQRRHISIIEPRQKPRATPKKVETNQEVFNVSEAARFLGVSLNHMRTLLEERRVYYIDAESRRLVPKRALETFLAGLPPLTLVEENIKAAKSLGDWNADDERDASRLRKEWKKRR